MYVESIDHIVLTVRNIERACGFYSRVLGMEVTTFGDGRTALRFGSQKINLHEYGKELEPKAESPAPGSGDLCFVTSIPIHEVTHHLYSSGTEILEGPVERTGALGAITSVYFRDPDGNLIEVSTYGGA